MASSTYYNMRMETVLNFSSVDPVSLKNFIFSHLDTQDLFNEVFKDVIMEGNPIDFTSARKVILSSVFPLIENRNRVIKNFSFHDFFKDLKIVILRPVYSTGDTESDITDMTHDRILQYTETGWMDEAWIFSPAIRADLAAGKGYSNVIVYYDINFKKITPQTLWLNGNTHFDLTPYIGAETTEDTTNLPLQPCLRLGNIRNNNEDKTYAKYALDQNFNFDLEVPFIKHIVFDICDVMISGRGGSNLGISKRDGSAGFLFFNAAGYDDAPSVRNKWKKIPVHIITTSSSDFGGGFGFFVGGGGAGNAARNNLGIPAIEGGGGAPFGGRDEIAEWTLGVDLKTITDQMTGEILTRGSGGQWGSKGQDWYGNEYIYHATKGGLSFDLKNTYMTQFPNSPLEEFEINVYVTDNRDLSLIFPQGINSDLSEHINIINYNIPEVLTSPDFSDIILTNEVLDSRVRYGSAPHYIRNIANKFDQVGNWELEYKDGVAIGRHEPEEGKINYYLNSFFYNSPLDSPELGTGTQKITVDPLIPILFQDQDISLMHMFEFNGESNSDNYIKKEFNKSTNKYNFSCWIYNPDNDMIVGNPVDYIIVPKSNEWQYVSKAYDFTGMDMDKIEIRFQTNDSGAVNVGGKCFIQGAQLELGFYSSSTIQTGVVNTGLRAPSYVYIKTLGASGCKVFYSDNTFETHTFETSIEEFSLPTSTHDWGSRYIQRIKYII